MSRAFRITTTFVALLTGACGSRSSAQKPARQSTPVGQAEQTAAVGAVPDQTATAPSTADATPVTDNQADVPGARPPVEPILSRLLTYVRPPAPPLDPLEPLSSTNNAEDNYHFLLAEGQADPNADLIQMAIDDIRLNYCQVVDSYDDACSIDSSDAVLTVDQIKETIDYYVTAEPGSQPGCLQWTLESFIRGLTDDEQSELAVEVTREIPSRVGIGLGCDGRPS